MTKEKEIEDAGFVSAIWILSCNDPIPTMTYKYIDERLELNEKRVKELIGSHKELFSTSISKNWREAWEKRMKNGDLLPSRIASEKNLTEKKKAIEDVVKGDLFRSQFRLSCSANVSPIEITKWGLEHIEKARKVKIEIEEERWKKWLQILPLLIAVGTLLATGYWQYLNNQAQREIKEYEVSFKPKQDSYTTFVSSASMAFEYGYTGDKNSLRKTLNSMETNLYLIESLIKDKNKKNEIWADYNNYNKFLNNLSNLKSDEMTEEKYNKDVEEYRNLFGKLKSEIYQELFQSK